MPKDLKTLRLKDIPSEVWIILIGIILFFGFGSILAWFGPDPSQVVRASSSKVPDFSKLSREETIEQLKAIISKSPSKHTIMAFELSPEGTLLIKQKSNDNSFQWSRTIPLNELDTFLYAQQDVKGDRDWSIHIYCADYKPCINGSNSRTINEFRLNAAIILYISSTSEVHQILGLYNRLLKLHGAASTIDVQKNTIRISQEYWNKSKNKANEMTP